MCSPILIWISESRIAMFYAIHIIPVFPDIFYSLRCNFDALTYNNNTVDPLESDNRQFSVIIIGLISIILSAALFITNIWVALQLTGATAGALILFIFPAAFVLKDRPRIASRADKIISWGSITLALVSDLVAIYSNCDHKLQKPPQIFSGNEENFYKNGETLLEERISLFNGRTNSIYSFSVDDLNSMITGGSTDDGSLRGVWDGKLVQVKGFGDRVRSKYACREIAVATEMGSHRNVHRLLGCCLHTKYPVLVYEWEEKGTLMSRITNYKGQSKETLEWMDMLRIVWEIAHAVSYLHTAFHRPIVHRGLNPLNVFLDQDGSVRLSDFGSCISIPAGKKDVEDDVIIGTLGYLAPEYYRSGRVAESCDVFAFGILVLVLLTGQSPYTFSQSNEYHGSLLKWVSECRALNCLADAVDPTITRNNGAISDEVHLKAVVDIALTCAAAEEECRPTMVDVATQLKDVIILSSDFL